MAQQKKEHLVPTNMCVVNFGGWGRMFVVSFDDAVKFLSVMEHAEAYSQTYKDGTTISTIGGDMPAVEIRLLPERDYIEGVLNFESGADKP